MESKADKRTIAKVAGINKHIAAVKEKMNNRMARKLWQNQELEPSYTVISSSGPRALPQSDFPRLENPLVVGSILAGVVGVVIIAIIILGVWVRSRMTKRGNSSSSPTSSTFRPNDSSEHVDITSSISMSTLDIDENYEEMEDQTQSLQLDDTTFYSANDVSIPNSDGERTLDEGRLCEITLSPI